MNDLRFIRVSSVANFPGFVRETAFVGCCLLTERHTAGPATTGAGSMPSASVPEAHLASSLLPSRKLTTIITHIAYFGRALRPWLTLP